MLLSIVIPSFKRHTELHRLLYTIYYAGLEKDQYEVIISDDSPLEERNKDLADYFSDWMNIKYTVNTNSLHAPGSNRQNGLNQAEGKWVTFIDDDDSVRENSLKSLVDIMDSDEKYSIIKTHHLTEEIDGTIHFEEPGFLFKTLTHGKIYCREFLEKYNIHYNVDSMAHEDVFFNYSVESATMYDKEYNAVVCTDEQYRFYQFRRTPNSLSRTPGFYNKYIVEDAEHFLGKFSNPFFFCKIAIEENRPEVVRDIFEFIYNELCYAVIIYILSKNDWDCLTEENNNYYFRFFNSWKYCFAGRIDINMMYRQAITTLYENGHINNPANVREYFSIIDRCCIK